MDDWKPQSQNREGYPISTGSPPTTYQKYTFRASKEEERSDITSQEYKLQEGGGTSHHITTQHFSLRLANISSRMKRSHSHFQHNLARTGINPLIHLLTSLPYPIVPNMTKAPRPDKYLRPSRSCRPKVKKITKPSKTKFPNSKRH